MTRMGEKKNANWFWRGKLKGRDAWKTYTQKETNIKMGLTE
jgi:hypothetical protein